MNTANVLLLIALINILASLVLASHKTTVVFGSPYSIISRQQKKFEFDKKGTEDFIRKLFLIAVGWVVVGLCISQQISMVLEFALLNLVPNVYCLAIFTIIKPKKVIK